MGPITDLIGRRVTCVGLGNTYTRPPGYVIVKVQVDGVQGYTGGSCLSRTAVKPDSRLVWIFVAKFFCIIKLIIIIG